MSKPITISDLKYITPENLATVLLQSPDKIVIIDVRDSDHIGGHIKNSQWIPTQELSARMPELLRTSKDKEKVVFHCTLSQQRGPRAALDYARAKQARQQKEDGGDETKQEVMVLEGGFNAWQTLFAEDYRLTEGWVRDLWE